MRNMKAEKSPIKPQIRKFVEKVNLPRDVTADNFKKCPFAKSKWAWFQLILPNFTQHGYFILWSFAAILAIYLKRIVTQA